MNIATAALAGELAALERPSFLSLFDQAPVAVAMVEGPEHRYIYANSAFTEILFNRKEIVGHTVAGVMPEAAAQGFVALLDEVFCTGVPYIGNSAPAMLQQKGGDQRLFVLDFIYQPVRSASGEVEGVLIVVRNMTAELKAQNADEDQQRWLENILNEMPSALFIVEPKTGRVSFANAAADLLIGMDIVNQSPEDRVRLMSAFDRDGNRLDKDSIPSARAARGETMVDEEFVIETPRGRFNITASSRTIPAAYGHRNSALLVFNDVTRVRAAEEEFKLFAELAPQMPFITDAKGDLIYFSRQWHEYTGTSVTETGLGWHTAPIHHPEDLERTLRRWNDSLESGRPYEIEYRLRRSDGSYRWHLGRATPVRNAEGAITKWFGTNVDIHDQKMTGKRLAESESKFRFLANAMPQFVWTTRADGKTDAENANKAKSAFLANMSHEIRTPLGAILGFTDLLRAANLQGEQGEFLNVIERNGQALTRVIDDILDLSKVESGQMTIELVPFCLRELVNDVVVLFADKAKAKGITLAIHNLEDIPTPVQSDPTRIRQILINLVGNAVKFTSHGGVDIDISKEVLGPDRSRVTMRVRDTGFGIDDNQRDRLFQPFVQADNSTSRKFGGTGLGLALSRRLANALGGDVRLEKTVFGQGSTFAFDIEVETVEPTGVSKPEMRKIVEPSETRADRLENMKILLVDDSPDNRVLMNLILRREGAIVDDASDGEEAVRKATAGNFDIVLMDIQMPGMDGYSALAALSKRKVRTPVIALTAHAMTEERRRTAEAGFRDHVTKPVDSELLVTTILKHTRTGGLL